MSMNHKAYALDDLLFDTRLSVPLANALRQDDPRILLPFIDGHRQRLKWKRTDPMPDDLHAWCLAEGVQQAGDLALTALYNPEAEIGLGPDWHKMREVLEGAGIDARATLCGWPFVGRAVFDPGGLGTYFQYEDDLWKNLDRLDDFLRQNAQWGLLFAPAIEMLDAPLRTEAYRGLVVWF